MGSVADSRQRGLIRKDDHLIRNTLVRARSWIFEKGYSLTSKMLGRVLDAKSLLPIQVRIHSTSIFLTETRVSERILRSVV
jgi:hypothetical protein